MDLFQEILMWYNQILLCQSYAKLPNVDKLYTFLGEMDAHIALEDCVKRIKLELNRKQYESMRLMR